MSYKRAVRVTRQLSRLIDAFRSDVARIRHDRARQVRDGRRAVEAERVLAEVRRQAALHGVGPSDRAELVAQLVRPPRGFVLEHEEYNDVIGLPGIDLGSGGG